MNVTRTIPNPRRDAPGSPGERCRSFSRRGLARCASACAIGLAIITITACSSEDPTGAHGYDVPMRSDAELDAALRELCETKDAGAPVLVEFSAAWCSDCQRLGRMKQAPDLARELDEWPHLTVNVARFDRHREILDRLGIESIAHWAILAPSDCEAPITRWPRIADRTLEVSSGAGRHLEPVDLAEWLRGFRAG